MSQDDLQMLHVKQELPTLPEHLLIHVSAEFFPSVFLGIYNLNIIKKVIFHKSG